MTRTTAILIVCLGVMAACHGRMPPNESTTMLPAHAEPAPPSPELETIGREPLVTTTGSPAPGRQIREQFEEVTLTDGGIRVRRLIPRKHTVFRVKNAGTEMHSLLIADGSDRAITSTPLRPGEAVIVELDLSAPRYTLRCTEPGHDERVTVDTYQPR